MELERASKSSRERNPDRLSALPDGVICHILSFLPTRRSVQTSVLAKRWRLLWAHVPFIDLIGDDASSYTTASFSGIACTVLLRHKAQTLNTFRLDCCWWPTSDQCNAYELETCIATVVERNVQNLKLSLALRVEVPQCLLTCKTLVDLTMCVGVSIPPSGPVFLPNLKKLYYSCSKHGVDLARLLSGCPVLEDLTIIGSPISSCNISSPTLKRLSMDYLFGIDQNHPGYLVNITAPALTYLSVDDCSYKRISVLPPASLVEADISLKTCVESDDLCPRRVLKFLDSFCNVKCLTIWGREAEFPDSEMAGPYVRFGNLTELQFQLSADWRLLTKFLQSADRLQVLVFYETPKTSESWTEPMEEQCACLLHSLKTVKIYDFNCTEQGSTVVRFILRNAQVLKRMEIHCQQHDLQEKFHALQRISLVRRGSRECELVFY